MTTRTLTGRHVLAMFVLGFGTIITVNLVLAVNAVRTFPGLEVANSYLASQVFDDRRAAQEALGWQFEAGYDGTRIVLDITDESGAPVRPASLTALVGRPTTAADNQPLVFGSDHAAPIHLDHGAWRLDVTATAQDGTPVDKRITLKVVP